MKLRSGFVPVIVLTVFLISMIGMQMDIGVGRGGDKPFSLTSPSLISVSGPAPQAPNQLPAFPECVGNGCIAFQNVRQNVHDGTAQVRVWKVTVSAQATTGTNDSGPGSVYWALRQATLYPNDFNFIQVHTAGVIRTTWPDFLGTYNNIYWGCHTAPGKGIEMYRKSFGLKNGSDLVIRFCRFRGGNSSTFTVSNGARFVSDHNSGSWGGNLGGGKELWIASADSNNRAGTTYHDVTISHGIAMEGQPRIAAFGGGPRSQPSTTRYTYYGNVMIGPGHRMSNPGQVDSVIIVNNVAYGSDGSRHTVLSSQFIVDLMDNWWEQSKLDKNIYAPALWDDACRDDGGPGDGYCIKSLYTSGNRHWRNSTPYGGGTDNQEWSAGTNTIGCRERAANEKNLGGPPEGTPFFCNPGSALTDTVPYNDGDNSYQTGNPSILPTRRLNPLNQLAYMQFPVSRQTMDLARRNEILDDAGASRGLNCDGTWRYNFRDRLDSSRISWARTPDPTVDKTTKPLNSIIGGNISSWADSVFLRIYPGGPSSGDSVPVHSGTPCADADNDGMPDAFELLCTGGASSTSLSNSGDISGDGYLNIEEYMNGTNEGIRILSWVDNSDNEDGFQIWKQDLRGPGDPPPPTLYASVGPNITTYVDSLSYVGASYMVRAMKSGSYSPFSPSAEAGCR